MATGMAQNGLWFKRARLRGDVQQLRGEISKQTHRQQQLLAEASALQASIEANQQTISRHQQDIQTLSTALKECFGVEEEGPVRKTCPKSELGKHGSWTRGLMAILREAHGPVDTDRLAQELAERWALSLETKESWQLFRRQVARNLKDMCTRQLLCRLHTATGCKVGMWALKDS